MASSLVMTKKNTHNNKCERGRYLIWFELFSQIGFGATCRASVEKVSLFKHADPNLLVFCSFSVTRQGLFIMFSTSYVRTLMH